MLLNQLFYLSTMLLDMLQLWSKIRLCKVESLGRETPLLSVSLNAITMTIVVAAEQ